MSIVQLDTILKDTNSKYSKLTVGSINKLIKFGINRLVNLLRKDNEVLLQKNGGSVLFCKDFSNIQDYYTYIGEFKIKKRNRDNRLKTYYKKDK